MRGVGPPFRADSLCIEAAALLVRFGDDLREYPIWPHFSLRLRYRYEFALNKVTKDLRCAWHIVEGHALPP